MKVIGLSGTNGAGKDSLGDMLAERYGYLFVSMTDMLRAEARNRGEPVEREVLRTISAEWRRENGLGVLVDKAVKYYDSQKGRYAGLVVASLRNPGEADRIHELGGVVIWVDADPKVRYVRISKNAAARGRLAEDTKTFDEFMADEEVEMQPSGDTATLDMSGVKAKCDVQIYNNGDDVRQFKDSAEAQLQREVGL